MQTYYQILHKDIKLKEFYGPEWDEGIVRVLKPAHNSMPVPFSIDHKANIWTKSGANVHFWYEYWYFAFLLSKILSQLLCDFWPNFTIGITGQTSHPMFAQELYANVICDKSTRLNKLCAKPSKHIIIVSQRCASEDCQKVPGVPILDKNQKKIII